MSLSPRVPSHSIVSYHVVSYHVVSYHIVSCYIVFIVSYYIVLFASIVSRPVPCATRGCVGTLSDACPICSPRPYGSSHTVLTPWCTGKTLLPRSKRETSHRNHRLQTPRLRRPSLRRNARRDMSYRVLRGQRAGGTPPCIPSPLIPSPLVPSPLVPPCPPFNPLVPPCPVADGSPDVRYFNYAYVVPVVALCVPCAISAQCTLAT